MEYVEKIENERENFIKDNEIPQNVRTDILNSWIRCRNYGVDPDMKKVKLLSKSDFDKVLMNKKDLIQISVPIMINLYDLLKDTNYSIILTDENSVILKIIGNEKIMNENLDLDFLEGRKWSEEYVGTNAIGTCLYLNKPMRTIGAEHYCKRQHKWTCSAAPIHDGRGNTIGCIDLSGSVSDYHDHTLGIVAEAANTIQEQFSTAEHRKWTEVAFNSINEGILVVDNNMKPKHFNDKTCSILKASKSDIYEFDMKIIFKDLVSEIYELKDEDRILYRETSLYVKNNRIECNINVTPVVMHGKRMGYVILIKKADSMRNVVNKIAGFSSKYTFDNILTRNPKMKKIIEEASNIALNECTVLITGESGTGKELFAHSIHNGSRRKNGPFVAINCAALPKDLVESELFGYAKGSFTGASKEGNPGKFEMANGGTIFLDEIGELPLEIQSKLLRVLDNHTITRIGGKYERKLNVRVIAATNRDLFKEVKIKNFRNDLYFRLNVFNIKLIPLRERKEDVEVLAKYFLSKLNDKNNEIPKKMDKSFINSLMDYKWPGNVREIENVVERAYYLSKDGIICDNLVPEYIKENLDHIMEDDIVKKPNEENLPKFKIHTMDEVEKDLIIRAIRYCDGNIVDASKLIDVGKSTLYRKIKKYNLNIVE